MTGGCSDDEIVRVGIMDEEGVFRGVATTGVCIPLSRRSWMGGLMGYEWMNGWIGRSRKHSKIPTRP